RTGALKYSNPFSTTTAATSAAKPNRAQLVSATTRRPVLRTEPRINSSSRGRMLRGSMTSASIPCSLASTSAALSASWAMREAPTDDWYASLRRVHVPPFRGEIDDLIQGQEHEIVPRVDDQWPLADRGGSYGDAGKGILTIRDVKDPGPPESHKCLMGGSEYP